MLNFVLMRSAFCRGVTGPLIKHDFHSGASARAKRALRSTMGNNIGKLSIRENLVMMSPYVRLYVPTDSPGRAN